MNSKQDNSNTAVPSKSQKGPDTRSAWPVSLKGAEHGFYESILEKIKTGVWISDECDIICYANQGMSVISGISIDQLVGTKVFEDFSKETLQVFEPLFLKAKKTKAPVHYESLRVIISDSRPSYQSGWLMPQIKDDQYIGMICTVEDISERLDFQRKIDLSNRKLKASNRQLIENMEEVHQISAKAELAKQAKSEFLDTVSHEIRTPMNGVIGMVDLIMDTELTSEQIELAQAMRNSADSLMALINDILDFSRIESGQYNLEVVDFDLRGTLEDLSDFMAVKANEKGVEFDCLIFSDVPTLLKGDPSCLRQIFINLVGNAIKFVEKGSAAIRVSVKEETEAQSTLLFEVIDTGVGIPEDKVDHLFKAFSQGDGTFSRQFGGIGLGLAISKHLVELQEGFIGVESEEGCGSTFWFSIALGKQVGQQQERVDFLEEIRNKRILVVDDNALSRQVIIEGMKDWGGRVDEAANSEEALNLLKRAADIGDPVQIAFIRNLFSDINGDILGRKIKEESALKDISLVLMTPASHRLDAESLKKSVFSANLIKPVKQSDLYVCIKTICKGTSTVTSSVGPIIEATANKSEEPLATQTAKILLVEDNKMNQKVAQKMLIKLGYSVTLANNGQEGVEAFKKDVFDLILMDGQMPVIDGFQATKMIRSLEAENQNSRPGTERKGIPIIAVTANVRKGDRERFLAAGMDDYIPKPLKRTLLSEVITKFLDNGGG